MPVSEVLPRLLSDVQHPALGPLHRGVLGVGQQGPLKVRDLSETNPPTNNNALLDTVVRPMTTE